MTKTAIPTIFCGFGSLMDIDKLIPRPGKECAEDCFGSLMDIDKLIRHVDAAPQLHSFGSLMDIDKLILQNVLDAAERVLVL